ncbi:MAG: hypothetical protein ACQ5SW_07445 [Sphaerochaetaceae bacterium]
MAQYYENYCDFCGRGYSGNCCPICGRLIKKIAAQVNGPTISIASPMAAEVQAPLLFTQEDREKQEREKKLYEELEIGISLSALNSWR